MDYKGQSVKFLKFNRNLAYCTLLDVLHQMFHAWIPYGMVGTTVQTLGKLGDTSGKYQVSWSTYLPASRTPMARLPCLGYL